MAFRSNDKKAGSEHLGTFLGVFTPTILTILGVILFMRTGWVVGNVGLLGALLIVIIAHAITLSTALSVSAVATNMKVGAGGAYYIISRSLGLEIGGAVGIPLFLAQTFSVTLYAFGLAESLRMVWPGIPMQPVAAVIVVAVSLISGRSAQLALKAQIPIMVAIAVALGSLFLGISSLEAPLSASAMAQAIAASTPTVPFWAVFAVFFPAVTGLMAGISLSGDLKTPETSIPRGAFSAVLLGFAVYIIVPIVLSFGGDEATLRTDNLIWFKVAAVPLLIYPGIWGAIFSSAIGSMLGAPRTLEALAQDRVVPPGLRRRSNPRPDARQRPMGLAHILSTAIALGAVALGDLDAVAPVLTMFFLTTYGVVNLVAGLEKLSGAPSYRPTIDVHWLISIGGFLACLSVMLLIAPLWCGIAVLVEIFIYSWLRRRSLKSTWGDLRYGALIALIRTSLLGIKRLPPSPRNWRPHILLFAGELAKRIELARLASWLNQDRGILTVMRLTSGEFDELAEHRSEMEIELNQELLEHRIPAFGEVVITGDFSEAVIEIAQANGMGGLESNTLMFGWSEKPGRIANLLKIMRRTSMLEKSVVVCRVPEGHWNVRPRRIDVWWGGLQKNGDMMLLLAHLLSSNKHWEGAKIRVLSAASNESMKAQTESTLKAMLENGRIDAELRILLLNPDESPRQLIQRSSNDADLVFMGLMLPEHGDEEQYSLRLEEMTKELPAVVLVRSAGPFAGQLLV